MLTDIAPEELYGLEVHTNEGDTLGKVDEVYVDDATGRPDWAQVKGGFLGHRKTLIPVATAARVGDHLELPYDQQKVKDAPDVDVGEKLSLAEEARLFEYFGIPYDGASATAVPAATATAPPLADEPVPALPGDVVVEPVPPAAEEPRIMPPTAEREGGPATASTDDAMTRSEEELRVGTREAESGRTRLHEYVTTEHVEDRVPVRHDEARVGHEPIDDGNVEAAIQAELRKERIGEEGAER